MGGWKTKDEVPTQTVLVTPTGAGGSALDSQWTMMFSADTSGVVTLCQTPRDVRNTGTGLAEEPVSRVAHARFALNTFTVPVAIRRVRFSLFVFNVDLSGGCALLLTNPAVYQNGSFNDFLNAGYGGLLAQRSNARILGKWGASTVAFPIGTFHNPGSDAFLLGIEVLTNEVNFYQYHYTQPTDITTRQQIFDSEFVLSGTLPYDVPVIPVLFLGALGSNSGDIMGDFLIEILPVEATICVGHRDEFTPVWPMPTV
jgi:hypothetical protein